MFRLLGLLPKLETCCNDAAWAARLAQSTEPAREHAARLGRRRIITSTRRQMRVAIGPPQSAFLARKGADSDGARWAPCARSKRALSRRMPRNNLKIICPLEPWVKLSIAKDRRSRLSCRPTWPIWPIAAWKLGLPTRTIWLGAAVAGSWRQVNRQAFLPHRVNVIGEEVRGTWREVIPADGEDQLRATARD